MSYPKHRIEIEIEQNAKIEEVIAGLCTSAMLTRMIFRGQYQGSTLIVGPGDHPHRLLETYKRKKAEGQKHPIIMETAA